MNPYLTSITPDSLSGIIFALEGLARSAVLLNGPTGCKFYHSSVSDNQMIRQLEFDPLNYPEKWYFGQPRVPCDFLDNSDYVYGGRGKLTEAIIYIRDHVKFDLLCIVNSPGAALIGDDLSGIAKGILTDKPVVTVETPGFSSDVCTGFETGAIALLEALPALYPKERTWAGTKEQRKASFGESAGESAKEHDKKSSGKTSPCTVNILGLSLYHRNFAGDVTEIKRLLDLCGVTVNCALCAGSDLESVERLSDAALNIVIHPEYGLKTAVYLEERFGTPYYLGESGPPIGFAQTESFVRGIADALGADISRFTTDSERARARAYPFISRVNSLTGFPKGVLFAVEGTYSELYAYTSFLVRYFGLVPDSLSLMSPGADCFKDRLTRLLDEFGCGQALSKSILETDAELVFGSGNTIAALKLRKHVFSGIETSLPTLGYLDVIPKTHLGVRGALTLVEQTLNGMMF